MFGLCSVFAVSSPAQCKVECEVPNFLLAMKTYFTFYFEHIELIVAAQSLLITNTSFWLKLVQLSGLI